MCESKPTAESRTADPGPPIAARRTNPLAGRPRLLQLAALLFGLSIVAGVSAAWLLGVDFTEAGYWRTLGYPGVLAVSFISAAGVVVPLPGLAAVCGAGGLDLDVLNVGMFAGVGAAFGELIGYSIGFGSQGIVERRRFYSTLKSWMEKRGALLLFVAAVIPNPFFDLVGVAAGGTRYPVGRFMLAVGAGNILKNIGVAWACSRGIDLLPWQF